MSNDNLLVTGTTTQFFHICKCLSFPLKRDSNTVLQDHVGQNPVKKTWPQNNLLQVDSGKRKTTTKLTEPVKRMLLTQVKNNQPIVIKNIMSTSNYTCAIYLARKVLIYCAWTMTDP